MKRYLVYILLLIPIIAWAAITTLNNPGNWNDSGNWLGLDIGDNINDDVDILGNTGTIIVQSGDNYTIGNLQMNSANTLTIDAGGVLNVGIMADTRILSAFNTTTINVNGTLEIWGLFDVVNNLTLNVTGALIIHGNMNLGNNAIVDIQGDVTIDGDLNGGDNTDFNVDGNLTITGSIDVGASSDLTGTGTVNLTGGCTGPDSFCDGGPLDATAPVFSNCPLDISIASLACAENVIWTAPTASDNTSVDSFTSTHNSGDLFPVGTTIVTYTATDPNGNVGTCIFNVTVSDDTNPIISNCPANIVVNLSTANCDEVVNWVAPTAADNCSILSFNSTHNSGDTFPVGTTVVSYIASDPSGNGATCTFNVTVNDDIDPVITGCPTDIVVSLTGGDCDEIVNWVALTAADNCSVASFNSTHNSGDAFPVGITTVTYTAIDPSGNEATCTFNVTVNDNIDPVITGCPADIVVSLTGGDCDEIVNWVAPTAADNCSVASFNSTHNSGETFPEGITAVTYTAIDPSGNMATCTFNVTVNDDTNPVITGCPADIVVSLTGGDCDEIVNWIAPTPADNCSVASFTSTHSSGDSFPAGITTVTYTAIDPSGNEFTCSFKVKVTDNTPPIISNCPLDIVVSSTVGACDEIVSWTVPTPSDNCSVASFNSTHNPGDSFPLGTSVVSYVATDPSGIVATCTFNVTVSDTTAPQFDSCPTSVNISVFDVDDQSAIVTWQEPVASDNCMAPAVSGNFSSGDKFPSGLTKVVYTASDVSGNSVTCEFDVDVIGNKRPTASPTAIDTYTAVPTEICLDVRDDDGDALVIDDIDYTTLNGIIERPNSVSNLCFIYTSFDEFDGDELIIFTVCDNGTPIACVKVEVRISVTPDLRLTIYKAFSPDGDNINDFWIIQNIQNYPGNQVRIYDRLGGLIYSAKGYNNEDIVWDGRSNQNGQNILPSGTYFYKIDLGGEIPSQKGFIELVN